MLQWCRYWFEGMCDFCSDEKKRGYRSEFHRARSVGCGLLGRTRGDGTRLLWRRGRGGLGAGTRANWCSCMRAARSGVSRGFRVGRGGRSALWLGIWRLIRYLRVEVSICKEQ